jgi:hypothetical protein
MMQISYPAKVPAPMEVPSRLPTWNWQFEQRRFETDEARCLLKQNGLDDIDSLFALADRCLHKHKGRAVSRVTLYQPAREPIEAFVKMNWGRRRFIPRMTDLKTGQVFQCLPEREWDGIQAFRSLGLLVPERFALLKRGWFRFQEAVIIQRVPPQDSLDGMIRNGAWDQLSGQDQQAMLKAVVHLMQRIHQAGLGWRGTCTRHLFPERSGSRLWQFWLIDCEGVHSRVTSRGIARDYRKLYRAFEISGANSATLREFQKLTESVQPALTPEKSSRIRRSLSLRLRPTLGPSA